MEVGTLVWVPDAPQAAPDQAGGYQIPVSIKGGTYWALVDSGCNQTSIHQSLIQPEALDKSCMVRVRCVHGDVVTYPVVLLTVQFRGQKHKVEVAVNPRLRHPQILGTNWPAFKILLGVLCVDASCGKEKPEGEAAVRTGEAEPGPAEAAPGERSAVERLILTERDDFPLEQSQDESLKNAFDQVRSIDGRPLQSARPPSYPYFAILKDRLYRVTQDAQSKQDTTQLLVPKSRREMLFQAAHCNPMAGHLGQAATLNRLMARFFWPGIHENVRRWCAACRECQLVNPPASPKAPLCPLPLMQVPFERIGMDLIGPLERSARGHRFALVLVDYATRYPEAVALRNISAKSVAEALFSMISRVGIPKEILTDQGTAFMSRTIRELYELLGIKSIRTSVYHPQTDGLVERFNRTLKTMIRKFVHEDAKNWDKWLEPLLFAVREVPQASTEFSPFELLYGRQPRGVLDVLRETWEEGPSESKNEIQHVLDLRTKLHTLGQLSMENLLQAQDKQSRLYNRGARLRNFTPGDKVLVLLPTSSSKLLAKWQGPFEVTRQVGDLNYEVVRTDRSGARQIYHLNLLKKWNEVEPVMLAARGEPQSSITHSGPGGGSPLTLPAHRCSPVAERICGRVLAPARSNQPYSTPYWDRAGRGSAQPAVSFTGAQEKGGPVRIRGDARDGSNRRVLQWLGEPDRFGTENRRLGPILRGLSQGECGVEVRRLSNAAGWRVAWSAGYRSFLFDAGLN